MPEWIKLLATALGGGFTVKALDVLYQEYRRRSDRSVSSREFVDRHLDPLLKAADELVGKLRSLSDEDFRSLKAVAPDDTHLHNNDLSGLLFLFARLWAQTEIIRREGLSVSIAKDVRGRRLQSFFDCLESRHIRIVERIAQRAIGELMLIEHPAKLEVKPFIEFVRLIETDAAARRWIEPVVHTLCRTRHTTDRQRLLKYGAVVHALIDTLDPKHEVTRDRPSYPNKLSVRTQRDLRYRVFGEYLKFVTQTQKYLGPPKKRRP